ncbi:hypothetical protein MMC29_003107 [Sticta canariensis]|nr:hypothetical protein [Sticta canariensis]
MTKSKCASEAVAAEKNQYETVRYCLEKGAKVSPLVVDEASEFPEVFKVLVTVGGLDVNEDFETAGDMLINAVWEQKLDFTKWLLEHGADPNSGHLMADSTSAITAAAERGRLDLAELLVQHRAKTSGTGALAGAAERGHIDMVRWLLDHEADIDEVGVHDFGDRRKQKFEGTALHKAVAKSNLELAKLLVDRGAGTDVMDPLGRTPLARAKEESQPDAVRYLESIGAGI